MKLEIKNVSKKFTSKGRTVQAVNDTNLEIHDKEFFILLGPSGCGKSTLLNLIAGLEEPTAGEIRFDGTVFASRKPKVFLPPKERNIAMVFQSYALYPHLSVYENIAFPLRMEKESSGKIDQAVQEAAGVLKITDLLKAKPAQLSGGQRQRVSIARAIVRRPNLFLLDEPLSNLDAQLRTSMREELKELQRRLGITTVYVTHDQIEAMTLGDRIAVFKDGRPVQIGKPDDLYQEPGSPFVATFIGTPAMNLLKARITQDQMQIGDQRIPFTPSKVHNLKMEGTGECVVGIRPENIRLEPASSDVTFEAHVKSVESLGRDKLVRFAWYDESVFCLAEKALYERNQTVQAGFDLKDIHLFEAGKVPDLRK